MEQKNKQPEIKKEELKTPKMEFNPRLSETTAEDEKFFAYESQRAHGH